MDENVLIAELLPPPGPPTPAATEAARHRLAALMSAAPATAADSGSAATGQDSGAAAVPDVQGVPVMSRRHEARQRSRPGWLATAAAAVVAIATTAVAMTMQGAVGHGGPVPASRPSARAILLAAARHISSAPATGRYWMRLSTSFQTIPGGTRAHPYDITVSQVNWGWTAVRAGSTSVAVRRLGKAGPATAADRVAWRAAGSPRWWHVPSGILAGRVGVEPGPAARSASRSAGISCDVSIGYLKPRLLDAADCRQLPTTRARLTALLTRWARQEIAQRPASVHRPTAGQIVADGAFSLLSEPVSPAVDAAALRIVASYPGVRSIGTTRDLTGRSGPGFSITFDGHRSVFVIDPVTGRLLSWVAYVAPAQWNAQIGGPGDGGFARLVGTAWRPGLIGLEIDYQLGWTNTAP